MRNQKWVQVRVNDEQDAWLRAKACTTDDARGPGVSEVVRELIDTAMRQEHAQANAKNNVLDMKDIIFKLIEEAQRIERAQAQLVASKTTA